MLSQINTCTNNTVIETHDESQRNETRTLFLDFIFLKSKEKKLLEQNESLKKKLAGFEVG